MDRNVQISKSLVRGSADGVDSATACCATPTGCWRCRMVPTVLGAWLGVATGIVARAWRRASA